MGTFGDKFRKAREKKDISLDDVSNVTKISSRMLQAIEQERFDQLPGGVFNKGFIRAYAKHLGLNDEEAVADYLACLRQAQIDAHEVWQPDPPAPPRPAAAEKPRGATPSRPDLKRPEPKKPEVTLNRPVLNKPAAKPQPAAPAEELPELQLPRAQDIRPRRKDFGESSAPQIPWRIVALSAIVIVLSIMLWTRRSHSTNTAAASTAPAKTSQPAPVLAQAPAPANQPSSVTNVAPSAALAKPPNSQPKPRTAPVAPTGNAAAEPGQDPNRNAANQNDKSDVTVRTFPKSTPIPSEKSAGNLTLTIRATETSWISVTADGQPVSQETLIAPAHASVRATREIVARIGNAAGVTFLWNGQEIPADGAEAEVKTFVFDSAGMRVIPSTPSTH
ncbi:MAG TPA: RodZ domain-containing protein [Candidatus Binatus sp.]|jgi:cytoskeletal protein RodZ|nr:RodZ domain-containing protein [Candidatus Binatus sp.]